MGGWFWCWWVSEWVVVVVMLWVDGWVDQWVVMKVRWLDVWVGDRVVGLWVVVVDGGCGDGGSYRGWVVGW